MKLLRIVSATLVLFLSSIVLVQYVNSRVESRTYPARDYILHRIETRYSVNGSPESFAYITSWVKASGDSKTLFIRRKGDGTPVADYILANEDGQFEYESSASSIRLLHTNNAPDRDKRRSPQYHLTSPQYTRTEKVLGFDAYVLKSESDARGGYTEVYFAPEVDALPIKIITVNGDGSKVVDEGVKVEFSTLPREMFVRPNLTIDFSFIEQRIAEAEKSGNRVAAEGYKEIVANLKRKHQK